MLFRSIDEVVKAKVKVFAFSRYVPTGCLLYTSLERKVIRTENPYTTPVLKETIADSYNRLIGPAIEREVKMCIRDRYY